MKNEMLELHRLYEKHDYKKVAKAPWDEVFDDVYYCECGSFAFLENNKMHEYKRTTDLGWVLDTAKALKGPMLAAFRAWYRLRQAKEINDEQYYAIFGRPMPLRNRHFRGRKHVKSAR